MEFPYSSDVWQGRSLKAAERRASAAGVGKGLAALPSLRTGRETFASSGSPEKEMYFDSTVPFPYGATVASRAKPSSMPPVAPGVVLSFFAPPPGSPSPCPGHYILAFGYYAASALLPTRWHFRVLLRGIVVSEFLSSRTYDVSRSP